MTRLPPAAATRLALFAGLSAALLAPGGAASAASCRETSGARRAEIYVRDCLQVSAATHPPCNVGNACELILDEIRRNCHAAGVGGLDDAEARICRRYE